MSRTLTTLETALEQIELGRKALDAAYNEISQLRETHLKVNTAQNKDDHPCFILSTYTENNLTACCDIVLDYIRSCHYLSDLKRLSPASTGLKKVPMGQLWMLKIREFTKNSGYQDSETPEDVLRLPTRVKPLLYSEIAMRNWSVDYHFLDIVTTPEIMSILGDPRLSNTDDLERVRARYTLLVEMIRQASTDRFESGMMINAKNLQQIQTFIYPSRFVKALRTSKQDSSNHVRISTLKSYLLGRNNKIKQMNSAVSAERVEKKRTLLSSYVFEIDKPDRNADGKVMIGKPRNTYQHSATPIKDQWICQGHYLCAFTIEQRGLRNTIYRIAHIRKPDIQRGSGVIWAYIAAYGDPTAYDTRLEEEFTYEQWMSTDPISLDPDSQMFRETFPHSIQPNFYSENKSKMKELHASQQAE